MAKTKHKGNIAESFVVHKLIEQGFNVLVPWGEDMRYDLVSEKNGVFKKIQVKYVTPKNGVLKVPIRSSNNFGVIHYSVTDVDIIAAYSSEVKSIYFIPLKGVKNRRECTLRLASARNKQKKLVTAASKFEAQYDLLEK